MDSNWLFSPLSLDEFERRYFMRDVLVLKREAPDYYQDLLSIEDLDTVLATHNVSHPDVSLVKHGEEIKRNSYAADNGRIDPIRAARLFNQGCTLIFTQLQSRLPHLGRLCADLETLFSQRMQTNIYLTPSGAQGFAPHWDTHDVFVLQIAGRKRWTTYQSKLELPTKAQAFEAGTDLPGPVTHEFELEPGDMVYMPRGIMHSAKANEETSLHITTGMVGHTWADVLLQVVSDAVLQHRELRESLPLGWARENSHVDMATLFQERAGILQRHLGSSAPALEELAGEMTNNYASLSRGVLKRAVEATMLSPTTVVRVKSGSPWNIHQDGEACFVRAGTRQLQLPARVLPILQFLAQHPTGTVSELPKTIDEPGRLVLVRRLITEGLLECA